MIVNEIWENIYLKDYQYQISNLGRVKSLPRYVSNHTGKLLVKEKILKLGTNHKGYKVAYISHNGIQKTIPVHRLVALAFIPNNENLPQINHKDGNKENNHVNNLEWCDNSYNQLHAYKNGLNHHSEKSGREKKAVNKIDIKTKEILEKYPSIADAARKNKLNAGNIRQVIIGNRHKCGGYYWKECDK